MTKALAGFIVAIVGVVLILAALSALLMVLFNVIAPVFGFHQMNLIQAGASLLLLYLIAVIFS